MLHLVYQLNNLFDCVWFAVLSRADFFLFLPHGNCGSFVSFIHFIVFPCIALETPSLLWNSVQDFERTPILPHATLPICNSLA